MTVWWITLFSTYFLCLFARMSGKYKYVKGERVFRANALFAGMACAVLIFVSGFGRVLEIQGHTARFLINYQVVLLDF